MRAGAGPRPSRGRGPHGERHALARCATKPYPSYGGLRRTLECTWHHRARRIGISPDQRCRLGATYPRPLARRNQTRSVAFPAGKRRRAIGARSKPLVSVSQSQAILDSRCSCLERFQGLLSDPCLCHDTVSLASKGFRCNDQVMTLARLNEFYSQARARFTSRIKAGPVAQRIEHRIPNPRVAGSSPAGVANSLIVRPGHIGDRTYLRHR